MIHSTETESDFEMVTFNRIPAMPGTINDGSGGTLVIDGKVVGDYIELAPGQFYASTPDDSVEVTGSRDEVAEVFEAKFGKGE